MISTLRAKTPNALQHRYSVSLGVLGTLFISLIIGFWWLNMKAEQISVYKSIQAEAKELKQFVEGKVLYTNFHIHVMQYTMQNRFKHPEMSNITYLKKLIKESNDKEQPFKNYPDLKTEIGDLQIDITKPESPNFYRDLGAAVAMIPEIAALKDKGANFVWNYYYDAEKRWELVYPVQTREEIFSTTGTNSMPDALKTIFESDGTFPIELTGPKKNPERKIVWTEPYVDASGEGLMITLLAPVYHDDVFTGVVGFDVTLKFLDNAMLQHPLSIGRTLLLDDRDNVLADSAGTIRETNRKTKFSEIFKEPIDIKSNKWIVEPLNNSPLRLVVYIDPKEIPHK